MGLFKFIDWNHNGEIDPLDIGLTLAMIDEEERKRAEEKAKEEAEANSFEPFNFDTYNPFGTDAEDSED